MEIAWTVVGVLVPFIAAVGVGVLSLTPPEYRGARACFGLSALLLAGMALYWSLQTNNPSSRLWQVDGAIVAGIGGLLPAGLLWLSRRQRLFSPAAELSQKGLTRTTVRGAPNQEIWNRADAKTHFEMAKLEDLTAGVIRLLLNNRFETAEVTPNGECALIEAKRHGRLIRLMVLNGSASPRAVKRLLRTSRRINVVIGFSDSPRLAFSADDIADIGERSDALVFLRDLAELDVYISLLAIPELQRETLADARFRAKQFEEPALGKKPDDVQGSPGLAELLAWLRQPKVPFCVLLGDYGSGKTFISRRFAEEVSDLRDRGEELPVALYVDLASVPAPDESLTAENIMAARLRQLHLDPRGASVLCRTIRSGQLVAILDGFDERAVHLPPEGRTRFLGELRSLLTPCAKVVLTSRTHLFHDAEDERLQFKAGGPANREGLEAQMAIVVYLLPFDRVRIEGALRKMLGEETEGALTLIDRIYNLGELASRPVLLNMIAGALRGLRSLEAEGRAVGASDVYEQFAKEWLDRDKDKHTITPEEKLRGMAAVARELWLRGSGGEEAPGIWWQELPAWLQNQLGLAQTLADREVVDRDIRTAAFLTRDAEGRYRFGHRSFLEFFLARGIAEAIVQGNADALDLAPLSREVFAFAVDVLRRVGRQGSAAIETILQEPYRSRISENATRIAVAWSRSDKKSAPRPKRVQLDGASFGGEDLRAVRWPVAQLAGADLFGADLTHADLTGAELSEADLRNVLAREATLDGARLVRARLARGDFESASLRGVDATEAIAQGTTFLKADLSGSCFDRVSLLSARLVGVRREGLSLLGADLSRAIGINGNTREEVVGPSLGSPSGAIHSVAYSPDGKTLASGSNNTLSLWDAATGNPIATLAGHSIRVGSIVHSAQVVSVTYAPDGKTLASGSNDKTVRLWDAATDKPIATLEGHAGSVTSIAYAPDGKVLASGSSDELRLWDTATGKAIATLMGRSNSVAFRPDGKALASGSYDGTVRLWDAATGKPIATLEGHSGSVNSVAYASDGKTLASGSDDKTVRLWDAATGEPIATLEGHSSSVMSVTFTPDGKVLASGSRDETIRLWDAVSGKPIAILQGHSGRVMSIAYAPDGSILASGSDDKLRFWDAATGKPIATLEDHSGSMTSIAYARDGRTLALGLSKTVRLWNTATGKLIATLEGHTDSVRSVAYAPDGKTIASGSDDKTVRLWDAVTGKCIASLEGHSNWVMSVAYAPDGKTIASGSYDKTVRLWDAETGKPIATLSGHSDSVVSVAYAPGGKTLASGSHDKTVRLWNAATGEPIATLEGHSDWVRSVAYAPDGKTIASGSWDNTVQLWDAATGKRRLQLASTSRLWFSAAAQALPEGDEEGLRAITYVSPDFRTWSGYELRLAAEQGQKFDIVIG